jgi:hypothetical protein
MNEKKIRTLAEQVGITEANLSDGNMSYNELERFAELIVQECAGLVEKYGLSLIGSDENYLGETLNLSIKVQEAGNKIKEHFGVEE